MVPNDIAATKCTYNNTYYNSELEKRTVKQHLKLDYYL